jgi:hypothetical protein
MVQAAQFPARGQVIALAALKDALVVPHHQILWGDDYFSRAAA